MTEIITPKYMNGVDSGWLSLTNPEIYTGTIYYRKVGNIVEVKGYDLVVLNGLSAANGLAFGIMPNGYRPNSITEGVYSTLRWGNIRKNSEFFVSSGGTMFIYAPDNTSTSANDTVRFNIMYFV